MVTATKRAKTTATRVAGDKEGKGGNAMAMVARVGSKRWQHGWWAKDDGGDGKSDQKRIKELGDCKSIAKQSEYALVLL